MEPAEVALMVRFALLVLSLLAATTASASDAARPLSQEDRARMALDRLAFGARPGEV